MTLIDEKNNSDSTRRGVPLTSTIKIAPGDFIIQRGKNWNALLKTFRIFFKFMDAWLSVRAVVISGDTHLSLKVAELRAHHMFETNKLGRPK
jgi:hypothetical protein